MPAGFARSRGYALRPAGQNFEPLRLQSQRKTAITVIAEKQQTTNARNILKGRPIRAAPLAGELQPHENYGTKAFSTRALRFGSAPEATPLARAPMGAEPGKIGRKFVKNKGPGENLPVALSVT